MGIAVGMNFPDSMRTVEPLILVALNFGVWLGGRVVRTLDLRSIGREFES